MSEETTVAALIGLAVGLVKVLEVLVTWIAKKMSPEKATEMVVRLDPEVAEALRKVREDSHDVREIVSVRDNDGVPLVYSSRKVGENVSSIAAAMQDVSRSQEQIADVLRNISGKVDENGQQILLLSSRK